MRQVWCFLAGGRIHDTVALYLAHHVTASSAHLGQGMRQGAFFCLFGILSRSSSHRLFASSSCFSVFILECFAMVVLCKRLSFSVNRQRICSISDCRPFWKSVQEGKLTNAVIAKLSEQVHATYGKPCFAAGLYFAPPARLMTTPSLTVKPCDLLMVRAKPATIGNCCRVILVPSFILVLGKSGTQCLVGDFGSSGP